MGQSPIWPEMLGPNKKEEESSLRNWTVKKPGYCWELRGGWKQGLGAWE